MTYSIRLPRGFIIAFLASIYILGFILTPYWILHRSMVEVIFYLALTLGIGLIWLLLSANSLQIEFSSKDITLLLLLLIGTAILNYRALNSVLPFRGDEVLHVERTLELVNRLPILPSLAIIILFIAFILSGFKKQNWAIFIGIFMVIGIVFYFLGENLFEDMEKYPLFFLRYPFLNYWFFAIVPKLASPMSSPYHEALYRIIPLLSMVGTAWVVQKKSDLSGLPGTIALGIAVVTIPIVFYYSSILYLEPPMVFLMTVACLDINNLLRKDSQEISQIPGWYALLLIGFVKETAIPFLLCFIVIRTIVQLRTWSKGTSQEKLEKTLIRLLAGELGIIFSVLAPAFLYVYFRATLTTTRNYAPQISNLFDLSIYPLVIQSFMEQFGLFFFLFVGGCILLLRNRGFTSLLYYISIIIVILAFHITDNKAYVGYSRFNLFVLPPILAGSIGFVNWVSKQKRYIAGLLVVIVIGINLLLSPIHLDGVKKAYWGNYLIDTAEHYYPYQDALVWLKDNHPKERMLFTGLDFYYPFQFYWKKLDWKPRKNGMLSEGIPDETRAISSILEKAETDNYHVVVYRVIGKNLVLPKETGEFRVQVMKNSTHTLLIFYKP